MKKTDTRAFVPPLPLARPTASRAQAFRATALREVRRRPPTVVRPGMFVPHFSQRRTVSRGACICSSASRSRRRFPTTAAARPAPALPIARWHTCSIVAAPLGRPPAMSIERRHSAAAERPRPIIAWRAPQVGRFIFPIVAAPFGRPTAMSTQWAAPFGTQTPAAYNNVALGLIYNGVSSRSMRHPSPTDRDFHSAGGAFRHADVRGLFTAWRSAYYNGVSSRSLRRLPPADRDVHAAGGAFRHADARGGFRPANAAHTLPHFFPTCDAQEANLFI